MEWQEKLSVLPRNEKGRKIATELIEKEISADFIREEIYPRLESTFEILKSQGFQAEISPISLEENPIDFCPVSVSSSRIAGSKCILKFEYQEYLCIAVTICGKSGWQTLGSIAIDREPESPTFLIDSYISDFTEQFNNI